MYAKNNASGYDLYLQFYKFPLKGLLMYVGTMPLSGTYKYNYRNRLPKGCCCVQETMPLARTYMYNSRNSF